MDRYRNAKSHSFADRQNNFVRKSLGLNCAMGILIRLAVLPGFPAFTLVHSKFCTIN